MSLKIKAVIIFLGLATSILACDSISERGRKEEIQESGQTSEREVQKSGQTSDSVEENGSEREVQESGQTSDSVEENGSEREVQESGQAPMGTSNNNLSNTRFVGDVEVNGTISGNSDFVEFIDRLNVNSTSDDNVFPDWESDWEVWQNEEGWTQVKQEDKYVSYRKWKYENQSNETRIFFLVDTTSTSPESNTYEVDCLNKEYYWSSNIEYDSSGFIISKTEPRTDWESPQTSFEQELVNKACSLGS